MCTLTLAMHFNVYVKTNASVGKMASHALHMAVEPKPAAGTGQTHAVSAVPGMTLPEVRKALGHIRQLWKDSTPNQPFFISNTVHNQRTIAEFCTQFVYGHHLKRHFKSVQQRQAFEELERHAVSGASSTKTETTAQHEPSTGVMWWQQAESEPATKPQDPTQLWLGECPRVSNRAAARKRQRS